VTARTDDSSSQALQAWVRALERTAPIEREPLVTLPVLIERLADRFEASPALVSTAETLSYRELAVRSNRYSRWALAQGLASNDVVALLMPSCPDYLAIWLGITRIGATVALLNTSLSGEALAHSINIASAKHVIVGAELASALSIARPRLSASPDCWVHGSGPEDLRPLLPEIAKLAGTPLAAGTHVPPSIDARALYIYTSGTTGLPKAANVSHYRLMQWSHWFAGLLDTRPADRMYNCLPLYHSVGGVVATGATLVGGGAVVLRPRFSASDFWRDVRDERCTLFQYIGELCRYLVNSPPQPGEREHALRLACGNGLRPEVWADFQGRFGIPRILEYYAATEGNFSLYNCEGQPGAIGRIPPFLAHRLPVVLVKFDVETGEPWRGADGRCGRCATDEVGEAIGFIPDEGIGRTGRFEGYADPDASTRKLLRNVFKDGDAWYRTGDLMRRDARGFYYFVDRVGETYRWKGENVSTTEVLAALSTCRGVVDGVVYGVAVPGTDGRAGMAALVVSADFDLTALREELSARLPDYARPVFLRILPALEATGTFKPKKHELVKAAFDPAEVTDPLYFDDRRRKAYVLLDAALHAAITSGAARI
jgi:fatty-acyl-CoA synthase